MRVAPAPSDQEIVELLKQAGAEPGAIELTRSPYTYATSAPLEEIRVRTSTGEGRPLILKDLTRSRLIGDATGAKPEFLHEPRREIEAYRRILAPQGFGPGFVAAHSGGDPPRHLLLIERAPGVELWQLGELEPWLATARWLGGFHARFAGRGDELREADPHLLVHSRGWFDDWRDRASAALTGSGDRRAGPLVSALDRYDPVAERLAALPVTFVHGEFYPSNVIVEAAGAEFAVRPIDWEMAAVGPGLVDLAALVEGWDDGELQGLVAAYRSGLEAGGVTPGPEPAFTADLDRCRLHLALQWIGWSRDWDPPSEHAHDWLGKARELADAVGLT